MQIKLARFEGEAAWHFQKHEDEVFFVHKGRLLMRFRDRDELVEEGEFIVVPHGVERCPAAPEGACEVVLLELGPAPAAGIVEDRRTDAGVSHS
nr:cupin domain-containing protein [Bosea sp. BIWAKO-01]